MTRRQDRLALYEELRTYLPRYPRWAAGQIEGWLARVEVADGHNYEGRSNEPKGRSTRRSSEPFERLVAIYAHCLRTEFLGDDGTGCIFFERIYGVNQRLVSQLRHEDRYRSVREAAEREIADDEQAT